MELAIASIVIVLIAWYFYRLFAKRKTDANEPLPEIYSGTLDVEPEPVSNPVPTTHAAVPAETLTKTRKPRAPKKQSTQLLVEETYPTSNSSYQSANTSFDTILPILATAAVFSAVTDSSPAQSADSSPSVDTTPSSYEPSSYSSSDSSSSYSSSDSGSSSSFDSSSSSGGDSGGGGGW